jgi:hypothetical protein
MAPMIHGLVHLSRWIRHQIDPKSGLIESAVSPEPAKPKR